MFLSYYVNYTVGLWCALEVVSDAVVDPARLECYATP